MTRPGPGLDAVLARSVEVILEHQAPSGAYIAAPVPEVYRYSWFRDGAFIADAASRAGEEASAEAFFGWCADVLRARAGNLDGLVERHRAGETVADEEHPHCRYTVDGREVGIPWSNFQLDGLGIVLWALGGHAARGGAVRDEDLWSSVARYLAEFRAEPCFDWWEETRGVHLATLGSIFAGLEAVQRLGFADDAAAAGAIRELVDAEGAPEGRLVARVREGGLDASLIACATPFRLLEPDDPRMVATVAALEAEIAHGGVHRYPGDSYFGGGEWLLLAALLGWWYAEVGRREDARAQLDWVVAHAEPGGELPEQVQDHLLVPAGFARWQDEFGHPPLPLLWSHALTLTLAGVLGLGPAKIGP